MANYDFAHLALNLESTPLEWDPSVMFTLDKQLRIHTCNQAWDQFAVSNGGGHLERRAVHGRSVFDFVSGSTLQAFYRDAYHAVQATGLAWRHPYECSSPVLVRQFEMMVHPIDGGLLVVNALRQQDPHSAALEVRPIDANYRTRDGFIVMCSNCRHTRRVGLEETWEWVALFVSSPPRPISHGLCPACLEQYKVTWNDALE